MTIAPTHNKRWQGTSRHIVLVRVLNFYELLAAYGDAFQLSAERYIRTCLQDLPQPPIALAASWPEVFVDIGELHDLGSSGELQCERVNTLLSFGPIDCGEEEAFLKVETTLIEVPEEFHWSMTGDSLEALDYRVRITPVTERANERSKAYRADMSLAVGLLSQLTGQRLILAFQPVITAQTTKEPIYWEVFLRQQTEDSSFSEFSSAAEHIKAVERLGLIERLDHSVVLTVVGLLRRHRAVNLGCNVSAQSLKNGRWWHLLFDALQQRPDLASRLVIEITETSAITQDADAIDILQTLQTLGCKVAIDDMGAGYSTLDFVIRSRPDFIKINKTRLRAIAGEAPEPARNLFRNLVKLCADLTPCVVAEGIEWERARVEAVAAGSHALQGYLFGRPNVLPYWVDQVAVVRDAFEPDALLCGLAATSRVRRGVYPVMPRKE